MTKHSYSEFKRILFAETTYILGVFRIDDLWRGSVLVLSSEAQSWHRSRLARETRDEACRDAEADAEHMIQRG
ncbi:MAG: hypothetical protein PGN26_11560 [Xylophilus ampelinus]